MPVYFNSSGLFRHLANFLQTVSFPLFRRGGIVHSFASFHLLQLEAFPIHSGLSLLFSVLNELLNDSAGQPGPRVLSFWFLLANAQLWEAAPPLFIERLIDTANRNVEIVHRYALLLHALLRQFYGDIFKMNIVLVVDWKCQLVQHSDHIGICNQARWLIVLILFMQFELGEVQAQASVSQPPDNYFLASLAYWYRSRAGRYHFCSREEGSIRRAETPDLGA